MEAEHLATPAAPRPAEGALVARTVPVPPESLPADLAELLPEAGGLSWLRRGDGLVAWGEVARIATSGPDRFADADASWRALAERAVVRDEVRLPGTGPLAFGSFAFADESAAGGVLVVPAVVVGRRDGTAWVTTVALDAVPAAGIDLVTRPAGPAATPPGAVTYTDGGLAPGPWKAAVAAAVAEIRAGVLDKVVLARDVVATTAAPIDRRRLVERLAAAYPSCWTFSVDRMVGATPELLVRSEKGLVTSRVLAGTIRRTGDDEADLAHAAVLAHSSKDLEEHEYAVESLRRSLAPFCASANVPETPFVLHLPNVLHLATDVTAALTAPGTSSLRLAEALHPTAAVAGTPTPDARAMIARVEGMDRARYAGPVGWLGADGDGEWGIALRSAELDPADPRRLRLFAGCGVVAASDPEAEFAESEAKLEPMRHALG